MINYIYDCYQILNKVYSDKTFVKQAINSTIIEEKNRAMTIKTVYGVLDKDIELSYYIKALAEKSPKLAIRTVLKIAMYDIKYLGKKEYAVTENAVSLVKKLGKGGMSGFVNAFLRKFIKTEIPLPKKENEYLSIKYSTPLFVVDELLKTYKRERTEKILSASFPLNTLCFYGTDGETYLKENNIEYEKTPFENVYAVKNFKMNEDFEKGIYTYQSIGSVAICDCVDNGDKLLDTCSAPGGKSIRLSYRFNSVVSNDIRPHRVELINSYIARMKRKNITACVSDAKVFNHQYENTFDTVLVDAPCSGTGVMGDNPDIKLNREYENIIELNREQNSILENVKKYVKVGGSLVYSTCSIMSKENIEIIKQFIKNNPNFRIEKIDSKLAHEDIEGTNQFLPDISSGVGFYVAKLKREK